ncbi:hypothetical protein B566_EDAN001930 [Ephemera danica]|nr:hypothetical protein B566_EDAN001930 [Ephemera danica]
MEYIVGTSLLKDSLSSFAGRDNLVFKYVCTAPNMKPLSFSLLAVLGGSGLDPLMMMLLKAPSICCVVGNGLQPQCCLSVAPRSFNAFMLAEPWSHDTAMTLRPAFLALLMASTISLFKTSVGVIFFANLAAQKDEGALTSHESVLSLHLHCIPHQPKCLVSQECSMMLQGDVPLPNSFLESQQIAHDFTLGPGIFLLFIFTGVVCAPISCVSGN